MTLSDNSAALMETRQRADELQQLVAATERDRLLLQQRLDDTRSVCQPLSACCCYNTKKVKVAHTRLPSVGFQS